MATKRAIKHAFLATGIVSLCFALNTETSAQVARYQPQTPTVTPWLNLTRGNVGGLPNYHALVRPQMQQQQINQREQALVRQQGRQLSELQQDFQQEFQRGRVPTPATGSGSWFMTPGTQSAFQYTSGFYPEPSYRGRR